MTCNWSKKNTHVINWLRVCMNCDVQLQVDMRWIGCHCGYVPATTHVMTRKASLILRHIEGIACHTRNVKTKYVPYLQKACTYVEFLHTRNVYPIAGHLDPSVAWVYSREPFTLSPPTPSPFLAHCNAGHSSSYFFWYRNTMASTVFLWVLISSKTSKPQIQKTYPKNLTVFSNRNS